MSYRLFIYAGLPLTLLIASGDLWCRADRAASERAQWLDVSIPSEDDTIGVSLSAGGLFDRDVFVSFYVFGEEDRAAEDLWVDTLAHGHLAEEFYRQGFGEYGLPIPREYSDLSQFPHHKSGRLTPWLSW